MCFFLNNKKKNIAELTIQVDKPGTPVAAARGSRSCTPTMGGIPGPLASRVYHPPSSQQTPPQGYQGLPSRGNEPSQSPSPYNNLPYARPSMVTFDPINLVNSFLRLISIPIVSFEREKDIDNDRDSDNDRDIIKERKVSLEIITLFRMS